MTLNQELLSDNFLICKDKADAYMQRTFPAGIYLFKVINRNTRTRCEICSKLTIKIPKRPHLIM